MLWAQITYLILTIIGFIYQIFKIFQEVEEQKSTVPKATVTMLMMAIGIYILYMTGAFNQIF